MEEEIDLRQYITVLIRRWPWLVGLALLGALAAFVVSSFLTPVYEAEAQVLALKSRTDIAFEPRIRSGVVDIPSNDQTTLGELVASNDVAIKVIDQMGDRLSPADHNVFELLKKIDVETQGSVITIKARDIDPELATDLANTWATTYETYVNQLFNEQKSDLLAEVRGQLEDVKAEYNQTQVVLESFLADNQIILLEQSIDNLTQDLNGQYGILAAKYSELNLIEAWLTDAYTVRDQLAKGATSYGGKVGDTLAMAFLRNRSNNLALRTRSVLSETTSLSTAAPPFQVQINLPADVAEVATAQDAIDMIEVIEARRARVIADIETLSNELLVGDGSLARNASVNAARPIDGLAKKIQVLESTLEAQNARLNQLTENRDLAWNNLLAVQQKLAEVQLGSQITDSQVRVAGQALIPDEPVSPKRLLNTAVGGVLGGMIALLLIFGLEYWQSGPQPGQSNRESARS